MDPRHQQTRAGRRDLLVGDGSFLFGVPSSAQWVARRYGTPALTVIYNNRGWKAPKMSALAVHPKGAAAEADDFNVSFEPAADLPGVAAAARDRAVVGVHHVGQRDWLVCDSSW